MATFNFLKIENDKLKVAGLLPIISQPWAQTNMKEWSMIHNLKTSSRVTCTEHLEEEIEVKET